MQRSSPTARQGVERRTLWEQVLTIVMMKMINLRV